MGVVHAKGLMDVDREQMQMQEVPHHAVGVQEVLLQGIQARVDRVHVEGLGRTKDDIVISSVKDLFAAQDFTQVILKVHEVRSRLESLGIFKHVGVYIDTCESQDCSSDGLEITFSVRELKRVSGGISTLVGNNEGSLVLGVRLPNMIGRAEKLQAEYAHGSTRSSGFNVNLSKPFVHPANPLLTSAVFQQGAEIIWSGFNETHRGALIELAFESAPKVRHQLRWEGVWRELKLLPASRSFSVREEMGNCLKSSLKHTLQVDHRDCSVFPTKGILLRHEIELAGLIGGDVGFWKNEAELQANLRLPFDCVLQASVNGGMIQSRNDGKFYNISDRLFLGGPMTLRGFEMRGAGPHNDGCAVGSDMFWAGAVHLYTPLPFRPGRGGLGDRFRLHYFINGGNIGSFHFAPGDYQQLVGSLWEKRRWTLGGGLIVQIGEVARFEFNYCMPMSSQPGDRICHGLQFGIGVSYL